MNTMMNVLNSLLRGLKFLGTHLRLTFVALLAIFALLSYVQLNREPPSINVGQLAAVDGGGQGGADTEMSIPWPAKGSAALSVGGAGVVGASRDDQQRQIASLVKVMTAYVVMKDHPLRPGETGPEIKVEAIDMQLYRQQQNNGESVILVREGTGYTQYELLMGLLIPSGNNLAFMLARWSSGSVESFVERMNQEAAELGMENTRYTDPSGVDFGNVSTAGDQIKLAQAAMTNPILARIVGLNQASLPVAGVVYNVNALLGQDHLIGVKTGWTEDAGACFLFAADWPVDGQTVRVFGAVLGQDTLADAFGATRRMLNSVGTSLRIVQVVSQEGPGAPVRTAWGSETTALPGKEASVVVWPGLPVETKLEGLSSLDSVKRGEELGKMVVTAGDQRQEVPVIARESLSNAGIIWRLTRAPSPPW
ncbi:MAG TPA: D-alanyl-D-alanine carboxypeptidase [Dehalococcoidia bacterium]|nr:D-alanyl-D-alanine carboxypeptidase [Dehalococcoidia bacterium]